MKEVIWQRWVTPWLGQVWHALFPNSRVYRKIKNLSQLTTFLTWLRIAWPEIAVYHTTTLDIVEQQYINEGDESKRQILLYYRMQLRDLRTMFIYAIPMVIIVIYAL